MKIMLVTFVGTGLMLILIAIPLIERRIKPNPFYGFRVRATLENPDLWYDVNAHVGRRLLIGGFITCLSALLLFLIPDLRPEIYALVCSVISVFAISLGLMQTARYLKHRTPPGPPTDF
jgi:uncharacterized membrane protein